MLFVCFQFRIVIFVGYNLSGHSDNFPDSLAKFMAFGIYVIFFNLITDVKQYSIMFIIDMSMMFFISCEIHAGVLILLKKFTYPALIIIFSMLSW